MLSKLLYVYSLTKTTAPLSSKKICKKECCYRDKILSKSQLKSKLYRILAESDLFESDSNDSLQISDYEEFTDQTVTMNWAKVNIKRYQKHDLK